MVKVSASRADATVAQPDPALAAMLIYGPDQGLVRERARAAITAVAGDPSDPFRVVELSTADLRADKARLADEVQALAFGGGRRVVRVRDAADGATPMVQAVLDDCPDGALVVLEGGELPPRSSLRKLAEGHARAAAVACYADDDRSLRQVATETLRAHDVSLDPDALEVLLASLGSDRLVTRGELEKLALYVGPGGRATAADVAACVGDTAATSLDKVVMAAASGDRAALDRALDRAYAEGQNPVVILRAMARHLQRLHLVTGHMARGKAPRDAMKALRPPVIFTQAPAFEAQARAWPAAHLARAMDIVVTAETDCKTTGLPAEALCGRALLQVAAAAGAARRR